DALGMDRLAAAKIASFNERNGITFGNEPVEEPEPRNAAANDQHVEIGRDSPDRCHGLQCTRTVRVLQVLPQGYGPPPFSGRAAPLPRLPRHRACRPEWCAAPA